MTADWPDQPTDADTAVEQLEVHHAQGRKRTAGEQAALTGVMPREQLEARIREQYGLPPKYATGGIVESGVDGEISPPLSGCAYPPLGRGLDLLVKRYGADAIARISGLGGSR